MEKIKPIFVILATIVVIGMNFLAAEGYIGGITPNYISDKYPTFLTPAGYAFSIWGFIYLGLILFSIYQAMPAQSDNFAKVRIYYILNCLANCAWIWLWHHQMIVASLGAMLVILATLIAININLSKEDSAIARVPFGTYFGWVTVATIVNITIALLVAGFQTDDSTSVALASIVIIVAGIIGIFVRLKISNVAYGLAVTWGILAIAIKHGGVTLISVASILAIIALLIAAITPFLRLNEAK